jgi:ABC-type amino acid transport substrate-binding protein
MSDGVTRRRLMLSAAATAGVAAAGIPGPGQLRAAAAAPAGGSLLDAVQKRGSLIVGMTLQFPPEMYRDEKTKEPKGYDVELVKLMASDLKVKLDIQDQDFSGLIPALLAGKVDLLSVGLVGRPERAKAMWFSDPYVPYQQVVIIQTKSTIKDIAQLDRAGARITALTGSTAADLAKRLFPKATVVELDQQPAMLEVASGRADGSVVEAYLAVPFVKQNPTAKILNPDKPFALEFGAYGVPKGDVDWWMWVNDWLRYWKGKNVLQKLYNDIIGPTLGGVPVYKDIPRY